MARSRVGRGQRACTLLKARHAVVDVPRVRVHGRHADRGEVVGEVVAGVELAVLGTVPAEGFTWDVKKTC